VASQADLTRPAKPERRERLAAGIARGAALIAALTVLSRVLGLVRTLVFSQSIGATCLGSAYLTAYQVPNLISELAFGGTLTSAMVPVLARYALGTGRDPEDRARLGEVSSVLLTWAIVIMVPIAVAVLAAAGPIASLLDPVNAHAHCVRADVVHTTTSMIQTFTPQIVLYGIAVVLIGLLQACRRFAGPALAPVLVNVVLIASYLAFAALDHGLPLGRTPVAAELALSIGTTLSIAALVLVVLAPVFRLRLRFRPAWRLPGDLARRAGGLVLVGIVEFGANDLAALVIIRIANGRGETGALVIFNYAFLVFSAVYAVLAVSIVTSAFPVLSARDGPDFDRTCAGSTRAVLLLAFLGSALVAAIAVPTAHVLAKQPDQISQLIYAFALFAPGVAGIAVVTSLSRVMLALGRFKIAATALAGSWLTVIVTDVVLGDLVPPHLVVAALGLGNTIGQSLAAVPLVILTRRIRGGEAVAGLRRAGLAGLAAGAVGAVVGVAVSLALPTGGRLAGIAAAAAAAVCAAAGFCLVAYLLDRPDLAPVAARLRRLAQARS
jgi:putative peptidoglycan lipid II flippase